jgi:hypothetical protein
MLLPKLSLMGRAVATKGHSGRRLGRTIHKLGASVELSPKESRARVQELKCKANLEKPCLDDDSPVQNLRALAARKRQE